MSVIKFAMMLLAFEIDSGPLPGHAGHAGRSCKPPSTGLQPLPDLGTTDLHLVADDWSGTGNWASRVGGFTATVTGTPAKGLTSQFVGRSEITGFTSANYFKMAANAAHTIQLADTITYEVIVKTPATWTASATPFGYFSVGATQILNAAYLNNSSGDGESAIYDSVATARYLGSTFVAGYNVAAKYNLVTLVINVAAPRWEFYINGSTIFTDTTTAGILLPTDTPFGIGGRWNQNSVVMQQPWEGSIVEVVRHREALDDATVASRAAAFNAAKGY